MAEFLYILKLLCFCIYQNRTTAKRQAASGSDLLNHWCTIQIDETGEWRKNKVGEQLHFALVKDEKKRKKWNRVIDKKRSESSFSTEEDEIVIVAGTQWVVNMMNGQWKTTDDRMVWRQKKEKMGNLRKVQLVLERGHM